MGGGPLNKGVIQLLCAGTGRESRTISGPVAAVARYHEESATQAKMGAGQDGTATGRDGET